MIKCYRVIFLGLNESIDNFMQGMSRLGVSSDMVNKMMGKAPVILKEQMTLEYARRYAEAIQYAGGRVRIQENGLLNATEKAHRSFNIPTLENFIMCPQCGYKQLKSRLCERCGYVLKNEK
jgi:ribosomal protein L32